MPRRDKLIDRIRKLLELGDARRNNSVEEAATAAALAQRLMFEHRISLQELASTDDDDPLVEIDTMEGSGEKRVLGWKRRLLAGIARTSFCRVVYQRSQLYTGERGRLWVLGRQSDVDTVVYLYRYLEREINRLARRGPGDRRWRASFRLGAASRISERLQQQRREQEAVARGERVTDLIRRATAEVDAFVDSQHPDATAGRRTTMSSAFGYVAGMAAADNVPLQAGPGRLSTPAPRLPGHED